MDGLWGKIQKSKAFRDLSDQEFSWVLYDVGNSAYTMIACSLIPIWFKDLAIGTGPGQITSDKATAYFALATSIITIIQAILGPALGTFTDREGRRKLLFNTILALGAGGCILNGLVNGWLLFLIIYLLTKIFYQTANVVYDSMLNDVTTDERMDVVSSYGYAWGYIGSCIPFLIAMIAYVMGPDMLGVIPQSLSRIIGFTVTAIWWVLVSMPLLKNYEQKYFCENGTETVGQVFKRILSTLKNIFVNEKKILFFLLAFFFYIDGVGTIIDNCINIGTDLGLPTIGQVVFLLGTQVVAWIGSLVFAKLSKKHSTSKLLTVCIFGYFFVCLYALVLKSLWQFGVLAFGVGCFQGSIQSLSRSYFAKIIPEENSGEYFGLYDIFSKGASFLGSLVIASVKLAGGTINIAVASLAVFFLLGFVFLKLSTKQA